MEIAPKFPLGVIRLSASRLHPPPQPSREQAFCGFRKSTCILLYLEFSYIYHTLKILSTLFTQVCNIEFSVALRVSDKFLSPKFPL